MCTSASRRKNHDGANIGRRGPRCKELRGVVQKNSRGVHLPRLLKFALARKSALASWLGGVRALRGITLRAKSTSGLCLVKDYGAPRHSKGQKRNDITCPALFTLHTNIPHNRRLSNPGRRSAPAAMENAIRICAPEGDALSWPLFRATLQRRRACGAAPGPKSVHEALACRGQTC